MQVAYLTTALLGCISSTQYYLCEQHLMYLDITIGTLHDKKQTMMLQYSNTRLFLPFPLQRADYLIP